MAVRGLYSPRDVRWANAPLPASLAFPPRSATVCPSCGSFPHPEALHRQKPFPSGWGRRRRRRKDPATAQPRSGEPGPGAASGGRGCGQGLASARSLGAWRGCWRLPRGHGGKTVQTPPGLAHRPSPAPRPAPGPGPGACRLALTCLWRRRWGPCRCRRCPRPVVCPGSPRRTWSGSVSCTRRFYPLLWGLLL